MAKKKFYRYPLYLLARLAAAVPLVLPRGLALAFARGIGRLAYLLIGFQRKMILENLRFAFGSEKTENEIRTIARDVIANMLETSVDFLRFAKLSKKKAASFIDIGNAYELCKDILQEGKGLIIMTPHFGNWELLAGIFGLQGFRGAVVGRRIYYEPYNKWIVGLRRAVGVETIYQTEAVRQVHHHLKKGEIVGLLPDQDMDRIRGIFVDFFGKPAYTMLAPVKFSLASGAPILPAFMVRMPGDRYKLVLGELIRPKAGGDRDQAVRRYTEAWMKSFEGIIREHPAQWGWMHNRWRTTPEMIEAKKREAVAKS
jgi:KDO2-lipid IV(A) lauroyltransferase